MNFGLSNVMKRRYRRARINFVELTLTYFTCINLQFILCLKYRFFLLIISTTDPVEVDLYQPILS